jgi:hypothetical protein
VPRDPREVESRKYDRFTQIWSWLKGLGVCRLCGVGVALAQVEREFGDPTFRALSTKDGCARKEPTACLDLARSKWSELPKQGATK